MDIKLIGIDVDGTLTNSQNQLTQATVQALQAASEQGIHVVIATGRFFSELTELIEQLPMVHYAVTTSGARVLELQTGKILYRHALTADQLRTIYSSLRELDAMLQIFSDHDGKIHNRASDMARLEQFCSPALADLCRRAHVAELDLDRFVAEYEGFSDKMHMFFPNQQEKEKGRAILARQDCEFMQSMYNDLELVARGVDKGRGLQALAEHLGLDRSQVMAIGDSGNDLAMLRYAGFSVAMGNSSQDVLDEADYITATNDEDGVARAVWHVLKEAG